MGNADRGISLNTLAWVAAGLCGAAVVIAVVLWARTPRVYLTNGLDQPMLLQLDEQTLTVPPEDWTELEGVSIKTTVAQVSLDRGKSWKSIPIDLSRGARAVVINPYGAAWVYTQGIVYSENSDMESLDPEHHCGEEALRVERAAYRFEPTPDTIELSQGKRYTTRFVVDMGGSAQDCIYSLQQDGELQAAEGLMTRILDPSSESMVFELGGLKRSTLSEEAYLAWLEGSVAEHQTLPFMELHTSFLMQTPAAQSTLDGLKAQLEADPGASEAAYLYSLWVSNEESLPGLLAAVAAHPLDVPLNRRLATIYEEQGHLEQAVEHMPPLFDDPEIGLSSQYWAAKTYMRLGRPEEAEALLIDSAPSFWPSAVALGHLRAQVPKPVRQRWRAQGQLPWLKVYTGEQISIGAEPALRLAGLVINGPTERLMASALARDPSLIATLEDHELLLMHLQARQEDQWVIADATAQVLRERPVLEQGLKDPFDVPANAFDELSVAAACMSKLWFEELSPEDAQDMVLNVNYFDPFGLVSAPAGWLNEPETAQGSPEQVEPQ